MSLESLSPIAPARVKALLLPLGQIKADRFASFVQRLHGEHVVYLKDITADPRPNRNMFSPLAFPDGAIFYDLITHMPPPSHLSLSPFDLYREPLAVVGIADGVEVGRTVFSRRQSAASNGTGPSLAERNVRALYQELEDLRDNYAKALVHHVLIFDFAATQGGEGREDGEQSQIPMPEGVTAIPPPDRSNRTTMKTVMCDISSLLLAEMTTLARSFEAMTFVDSPGQMSVTRQMNGAGASWASEESLKLARRNSQYSVPTGSRSSSASGIADRSQARMSMPPGAFNSRMGSSSSTPARPSTPVRSGLSNPPTNFDDMASGTGSDPSTPEQNAVERPGTAEGMRSPSQDRVSVQGFGPGGVNERWRTKGKGRVSIVIGSLYLQAGRWSDALKELSEGAAVARSINDHIWHGKALELIVVGLMLLGWAQIEFQVPSVCLTPPEKGVAPAGAIETSPDHPRHLRNLQAILPDLLDRIFALYSRISAEHLPPLPLSESAIRFCKILSAVHMVDGKLSKPAFDIVVYGTPPIKPLTTSPRLSVTPTRQQIVTLLFKAFPSSASELLTTADRAGILSGMASVLGPLGLQRKKAMVIRELVSVLVGGLVEARTRGAADVGIHPAAGLVALTAANGQSNGAVALELGEGDIEHGIEDFLGLLCQAYGIVSFDVARRTTAGEAVDDSDDAAVARIQAQSAARFFGFPSVKLNILRACINFSEALPDFNGVLKFSSDLLRTAGSGVAPGPRREDASPIIPRDEQVRLAANISKTYNLAQRLGLSHLAAEYWDEFLIRGVSLEPLASTRMPIPRAKSVLQAPSSAVSSKAVAHTSQDVNPLIHNPFLKPPDKAAVEHLLVAGEPAMFKITMQNPYEIEVDVESVRLDTEGIAFESTVESTIIGPYRTQILKIMGTPKEAGALKVTGAIIRIRGCRERRFAIFRDPWTPEGDLKIKATGLPGLEKTLAQPHPGGAALKAEEVAFKVIPPQPVVAVKSTTLPQSSVMILEGERQVFSVTLQNLSATTPVDFMLFSFQDSTQAPLQAALANRDATPAELYEYELILLKKQALRARRKDGEQKRYIAPGGTATFEFEVLGKPGLTNAGIQVDYAHLGVPADEIAEPHFHTRQVSLELTVTVNASVELARLDILPLAGPIPQPVWKQVRAKEADPDVELSSEEYCLVSMDLRNAWPSHMAVHLDGDDGVAVDELILPGNTSRVVLPVKRIYLEDPHASIPALNPSRQRQFVVSSTKLSPDTERANREAFWYRERILDTLKASWTTQLGARRTGSIELRSVRLTTRMIEAVKVDEVGISISVESPEGHVDTGVGHSSSRASGSPSISAGTDAHSTAFVDEFLQLRVRITNRTTQPIYPLLRLMPALCHRPINIALDLTRKLAWNGTLQQFLPLLPAQTSTDVIVGATALCRGEFELTASVEEARIWEPEPDGPAKNSRDSSGAGTRRPRSDTQSMLDAALGAKERRIWHSRQPCVLMITDPE